MARRFVATVAVLAASLLAADALPRLAATTPQVEERIQPSTELDLSEDDELAEAHGALRVRAFERLFEGSEQGLHDTDGLLTKWMRERLKEDPSGASLSFTFRRYLRTASGELGFARISSDAKDGSFHAFTIPLAFVQWEPLELWTMPPWQAFRSVVAHRVVASVSIDPVGARIDADATIDASPGGSPTLAVDFMAVAYNQFRRDMYDLDESIPGLGMQLDEVSFGGKDCSAIVDDHELMIATQCRRGASVPERGRWRVRYRGSLVGEWNSAVGGVAVLRHLLPIPVGTEPALELVLRTPPASVVLGLGAPTSSARDGQWQRSTWRWPAQVWSPQVTVVAGNVPRRHVEVAGVPVEIYGAPVPGLQQALGLALTALAELGIAAPDKLVLVIGHRSSVGADHLVVGRTSVRLEPPEWSRWNLARLLAERALCRAVSRRFDGSPLCLALASYLALVALPPALRPTVLRSEARDRDREAFISILAPVLVHRSVTSYRTDLGAQVLWTLGERLGHERLLGALRSFITAAPPPEGLSWHRLVAAVERDAGSEVSGWLRQALAMQELPEVELRVRRLGPVVEVGLESEDPLLLGAAVEVAFLAGEHELSRRSVQVGSAAAPASFVVAPHGAERVVVDPDARALLRYEVTQDGELVHEMHVLGSAGAATGAAVEAVATKGAADGMVEVGQRDAITDGAAVEARR